jgi:hypothetical protein
MKWRDFLNQLFLLYADMTQAEEPVYDFARRLRSLLMSQPTPTTFDREAAKDVYCEGLSVGMQIGQRLGAPREPMPPVLKVEPCEWKRRPTIGHQPSCRTGPTLAWSHDFNVCPYCGRLLVEKR